MRSVRLDPEKLTDALDIAKETAYPDDMDDPAECYHCHAWFDRALFIDKESLLVCEDCYVGK